METTLNTLKNTYAQEQGYEDWVDLYRRSRDYIEAEFIKHEDAVFILAQKAALEKAADKAKIDYCPYTDTPFADKESITNPENLIR